MIETLVNGYSSESTSRELFNEYQHDMVQMFFKDFCVIVIWTMVAAALEGLNKTRNYIQNMCAYFQEFETRPGTAFILGDQI